MSHGFLHGSSWVSIFDLLLRMLRGSAIEGRSILVVLARVDSINIRMIDVPTFRDITASELCGTTVAWCPHFNIFWMTHLLMATVKIVVRSDTILITLLDSLMYRRWLVHHNSLTITLMHHTLGSIIVGHALSDRSLILVVHGSIWTMLASHTVSQALPGQKVLWKTLNIP